MDHAAGIGEEPHTATSAGAGRLLGYCPLFPERTAFVARARNPDLAAHFTRACALSFTVPTNINIPVVVGRYRTTAVQSKGLVHEISLRPNRGASVVEASVEHRRSWFTSFRVHRPARLCRI